MNDEAWVDPRGVAAVVHDVGVAVDHLLFAFARDLATVGVRVGGLVQLPRSEPGCGPQTPMQLRDVATGEAFSPCENLGPTATECRLDPVVVQRAAKRIHAATEAGAELIFVPRFGREEARGEGFRNELARAISNNRRVLMAVPRGMTDNWLAFNDGIGTLLDARLWVLKDWWNELRSGDIRCRDMRKLVDARAGAMPAAPPGNTTFPSAGQSCRSGSTGSLQVGESVLWVQAVQEFELPAVPFPSRRIFDIAGEQCLRDLVRKHHDNLRHSDIRRMFPEADAQFEELVAKVADYIVEACGGPPRFTPVHGNACMRARHYPFTIDEKAREIWLQCLWRAFDTAEFPKSLRREYWDWMEAFSVRMINRRTMRAQPTRVPFDALIRHQAAP